MANAGILPVASTDTLVMLKRSYQQLDPTSSGFLSKEDFLSIPLWFEQQTRQHEQPSAALNDTPTTPSTHDVFFNRPQKLKSIIFSMFKESAVKSLPALPSSAAALTTPLHDSGADIDSNESECMNYWKFLASACMDLGPSGFQRALVVLSGESGGRVSASELFKVIFRHLHAPFIQDCASKRLRPLNSRLLSIRRRGGV